MKPILLVEDNENDILLTKRACERAGFPHNLHVARDGVETVAYLSGEGRYADREKYPLPHLIFLDIKMPRMDGHAVLKWIRSQPKFAHLPVVMLTTSCMVSDIERAYASGVNSFLRKKNDMVEFEKGMGFVLKYWLEMNTGPEKNGAKE